MTVEAKAAAMRPTTHQSDVVQEPTAFDDTVGEVLQLLSIDSSKPGVVSGQISTTSEFDTPLDESNLTVTVNGDPVDLTVTSTEIDSIHVTLIIDVSGSMAGEALEAAKTAAVTFVESMPPQSKTTVISFGDTARVDIAASPDVEAAVAAITALEPRGETALYDGIQLALDSTASATRQVAVVLSDGGDTASIRSLDDVAAELTGAKLDLYSVALTTDESDTSVLDQLVATGSGTVTTTDDLDGLAGIYESLANDLAEVYQVTFPVESGGPVTLALTVDKPTGASEQFSEAQLGLSRTITLPATASQELVISQPEPTVQTVTQPGIASDPNLVWLGGGLLVVAVLISAIVLVMESATARPAARRSASPVSNRASQRSALRDMRQEASSAAEAVVKGTLGDRMGLALDQAGLRLRVGEVVLAAGVSGVLVGGFGWTLAGLIGAAIGFGVGLYLPRFYLRFRFARRRKKFANQLPDILAALANVIRVGYSLNRAVDTVAQETEEPARSEFKRALIEARVGGDFVESLRTMADRTGSVDLRWTADAVEINTTVGGDLTEVLDSVAETIRARIRLKAQVDALTAEGRVSAFILFILPPGISVFIAIVNPQYFDGIWEDSIAYFIVGAIVLLMAAGGAWLKKMIASV